MSIIEQIGPNRYRVPYSQEQADAHCDRCLYGLSYGVEVGSDEYVIKYLREHGIPANKVSLGLDDSKLEYTVTVLA